MEGKITETNHSGISKDSVQDDRLERGLSLQKHDRKTSGSKTLKILVAFFVTATIALAVSLGIFVTKYYDLKDEPIKPMKDAKQHHEAGTQKTTSTDVCVTKGCTLAAARIQTTMDDTVNPCDDMFQFACGKWIKDHVIPEDKSMYAIFDELQDDVSVKLKYLLEEEPSGGDADAIVKAKHYYQSCINTSKIEDMGTSVILSLLRKFGGWPVLGTSAGGHWNSGTYNMVDFLVKVSAYMNIPPTFFGPTGGPFFNMFAGIDDKHPTKHVLELDQSGLGMPSRDYYLKRRDDPVLMAYQNFAVSMATALGAEERTAAEDMKNVVDLEIDVANITVPKEERRNMEKLYNLMTVGELSRNFSGFQWLEYAQKFFNTSSVRLPITADENIVVAVPTYFQKLNDVIAKYDARTISNYVLWRLVSGVTTYLPEKFRNIANAYRKVITGSEISPARWQICAENVKYSMPFAVGKMFIEETFSNTARAKVMDLVDKLSMSFGEMIESADWMDTRTKQKAKEKLDAIQPRMAYPDRALDQSWLNTHYAKLNINADAPLENYLRDLKFRITTSQTKLRMSADRDRWIMSPAEVNAYYSPRTNQITFPAGILQPPFYHEEQPMSMNFGGIGHVIGHEMTHGFDDQGRRYDKDGFLRSWWTPLTEEKFKEKAQCIVDQYGNFTEAGMHLNGLNTQGENIADNGGIKETFGAYKKWVRENEHEPRLPGLNYSNDQLFFINAAQIWCGQSRKEEVLQQIRTNPHSPVRLRVIGPMQNFEEFAKAFSCPSGSYMNPVKKCSVW